MLLCYCDGSTTWTNTYNADGLRTRRTNGTSTYSYVYNGSSLVQMTVDGNTLYFTYDASGTPQTVTYNGTTYFYATNLQGDITAILNASGETVVSYTYDAWGSHTSGGNGTGTLASTLGRHNPLRYRGYVYDVETGLYYLQSRYYNPAIGRFINADDIDLLGTTGDFASHNLYAYCENNPIYYKDSTGYFAIPAFLAAAAGGAIAGALIGAVSYLVSSKITGNEITARGFWGSVGIGALNGALGGIAGIVPAAYKGGISLAVGCISGVYNAVNTEGTIEEKLSVGIHTGVVAAGSTYLGASIDTSGLQVGELAFVNYATTLTVGTPAEMIIVSSQQVEPKTVSRPTGDPIQPKRPHPQHLTCLMKT